MRVLNLYKNLLNEAHILDYLPFNHLTEGSGFPDTSHLNVNLSPSWTVDDFGNLFIDKAAIK